MQMFKRLSATVVARLDRAIRGMENHDAVVGVSLQDVKRATAETRVRLQRVHAECGRLAQRREEVRAQAQQWRDRARASADDEETALECLRRARSFDREAERLGARVEQQRGAEQRMQQALERLERRYEELRTQRDNLRSREAAARADARRPEVPDDEDLEEVLERWEVDVTEAEMAVSEPSEVGDGLAERFDEAEERASLEAELSELRGLKGEE